MNDRDQAIIAAYADNQPMGDICARYGVSEQEVQRLAADEVDTPVEAPRCPAPVIAAALLVAAAGAGNAARAHTSVGGTEGTIVGLIGLAIYAAVGWWLVKGVRPAQVMACIGAGLSVFAGLAGGGLLSLAVGAAILGLLLVPVSARDWFAR